MNVIERLTNDHKRIMERMDALSERSARLKPDSLSAFITDMWTLVSEIEEHEEFEEENFLLPLAAGVVDREVIRGVGSIRREHEAIFERLSRVQERLSACRGMPFSEWTDAVTRGLKRLVDEAMEELREHIRRENIGLFFLAAGRIVSEEDEESKKAAPGGRREEGL